MTEQGGGILSHHVDVAMTVEVRQLSPVPSDHRQRERLKMKN
jgi:hypothetical protein